MIFKISHTRYRRSAMLFKVSDGKKLNINEINFLFLSLGIRIVNKNVTFVNKL